ncbi:MAG: tetratricopeptide repeat protein [Verrucomicrobia bacterium]|nr:tetratricopeptide repeat protein [Verrucomicrobiota bacterium]MDA1086144.1 tetratricopeptide repeat protein [Verrucomicrobiota bacterium]
MKHYSIRPGVAMLLIAAMCAAGLTTTITPAFGAREVKGDRAVELAARRLLNRAQELLEAGESERGVKMLETVIQQHPDSESWYVAYLMLAQHYEKEQEYPKAVDAARNLLKLKEKDEELGADAKDIYLEGLYITGMCNFHMRDYGAAFAKLRQITSKYPNTLWANQAYYYIGMSHFAQSHWSKAIKALGLVGTFIDPTSPEIEFAEAGRRFYVKVEDADLPILERQGKALEIYARTEGGDEEKLICSPLAGKSEFYLGSMGTESTPIVPNDGILQIVGGDIVYAKYLDDNNQAGQKDVPKEKLVKIVSSASLNFTLATFEGKTASAFLAQPIYLKLRDLDLDRSAQIDNVRVSVLSRYRSESIEESDVSDGDASGQGDVVDLVDLLREEETRTFVVRDEVSVDLVETAPRSGIFVGDVMVNNAAAAGSAPNSGDGKLGAQLGDELIASYTDELHIRGDVPEEITAKTVVYGEIGAGPVINQNVVSDAFVRSKKDLIEAEAYLELARIFGSMGLRDGADEKGDSGLERVDFTLSSPSLAGSPLRHQAFRLKWNLYLAQDDLARAMATCRVFNSLYPESPLVDQALMGIAKVLRERDELEEAIGVFQQVLGLPNAYSKPEAQFLIAEIYEGQADDADTIEEGEGARAREAAVRAYKACAKNYPESPYAGRALGKVIDYHIQARDYVVADDLIEQVFLDYEDEDFLDSMLLKWVIVAYRMGNLEKAQSKCQQLVFEYPDSEHAKQAQVILDKIDKKLKRDEAPAPEADANDTAKNSG